MWTCGSCILMGINIRWQTDAHLQVSDHVVSARLQVNSSNGHVLPCGFVSCKVHSHQVIQAPT